MTSIRYPGTDHMLRVRMRGFYRDLGEQLNRVRPFSPEYKALTTLAEETARAYMDLYGEVISLPGRSASVPPAS